MIDKFIEFKNREVILESMEKQKGTFILSGHYSNWELTAYSYSVKFNSSLQIIAKIQSSKKLNSKINEYRTYGGNEILQTGFNLRTIYEKINENNVFCFLTDQSANPDYSVYINFFGQNTATFSGPAKIALKKRPGLILGYGIRKENYNYEVIFEKINYDGLIDLNETNIKILTQLIQSRWEEIIRNNPGQWLWLHKRFKHIK